jgi:hypothetical protein
MTETDTTCGGCGAAIVGESTDGDPSKRNPCPHCGSLARAFSLQTHVTVHFSATAELTVVTYPQTLLATSKGLFDSGQFGISVVVAHMACEVSVERALSAAFASRGLQYLEYPVLEFLNGFNLGNDRTRKLYTALTGDQIEQQRFWPDFKASAIRRNKVIHNGCIVGKAEAESSFTAASLFVAHLGQ